MAIPVRDTPAYEMPIPYATRLSQCGKRLILQNFNVTTLYEDHPELGSRPWPMEFEGREFATVDEARRAEVGAGRSWFFDTWAEAEGWLLETPPAENDPRVG
jgi:hypothetical protein